MVVPAGSDISAGAQVRQCSVLAALYREEERYIDRR